MDTAAGRTGLDLTELSVDGGGVSFWDPTTFHGQCRRRLSVFFFSLKLGLDLFSVVIPLNQH